MFRIGNSSKSVNYENGNKIDKLLLHENSTDFIGRQMLVSRYSSFVILALIVLLIIIAYSQHLYAKYKIRTATRRSACNMLANRFSPITITINIYCDPDQCRNIFTYM